MGLTGIWEETPFEREHLIVGSRLLQHFLCARSATIIPTSQMNKVRHRGVKQNALTPCPESTIFRMTSQLFLPLHFSFCCGTNIRPGLHSAIQLSKYVSDSKCVRERMGLERTRASAHQQGARNPAVTMNLDLG